MKPFGIVSDLHCHSWSAFAKKDKDGVNSRLKIILEELSNVVSHVKSLGGERLYIAGDIFHVRGNLETEVFNAVVGALRMLQYRAPIEIRAIPGNHDLQANDCAFWHTSAVSALHDVGVACVVRPTYFDDDNVLMVPWVNNVKDLLEELAVLNLQHPGANLILHAPLNGVLRGIPPHGINAGQLEAIGFNKVYSGHFHNHVNFGDRVYSIGALTHQTWNDVDTKAGYLIVDGDTVTHYETNAPKFIDFDPNIPEQAAGNYVRVKLQTADQTEISKARDVLETLGALGVVIQAVPKPANIQRLASVQAGASIPHSISDYVKTLDLSGLDEGEVVEEALDVLGEAQ